ncbi:glycosyltransferase family 2 protein [Geminocystis herdmanii]|uniref:glycosyltransferase family 2 protein n=1 Tax=Geminocystis herdmanii TaxID=669359 RepID=UPI0003484572|nr:glycosyltransferase family 2 protein [Geminocystis herdmanii]
MNDQISIEPLVSIIMSVFNEEKYVADAIESILNQTYQNWEFIIINDGSIDGTESIINQYQDHRIRYFYQENMGLTKSLNKGIALSQGKYIARIDADDRSLPTRIEQQVNFLENNITFVLIGSYYYNVDISTMILSISKPVISDKNCRKKLMFGKTHFLHSSVMFKKEINGEIMRYDETFKHAQDARMWIHLATKGQIGILPEILVVALTKRPSSITINRNNFERLKSSLRYSFIAFQEFKVSMLTFPIAVVIIFLKRIASLIVSTGISPYYYQLRKFIENKNYINISSSDIPNLWNGKKESKL